MTASLLYRRRDLDGITADELLGGKGSNLVRLAQVSDAIPPFYIITTDAFRQALTAAKIDERIQERLASLNQDNGNLEQISAEIRSWFKNMPLSKSLADEIQQANRRSATSNHFLAVRSSATGEDSDDASFAGMHDSVLFVQGINNLLDAIRAVWASAYSARALSYRMVRDLPLDRIAVAVVIQLMVDAKQSGVMFTCNPADDNAGQIVISSVYGAGEGLVSGLCNADTYVVDKQTLNVESRLASKDQQMLAAEKGGLKTVDVPMHLRMLDSLTPGQIDRLSKAALEVEQHFGRPQDVEFCFDDNDQMFLLQARPVTGVKQYGPAARFRTVWDNSNIIESYSGVTSPMTFSFIRRAYTIVYHCFAEVMGISPRVVRDNRETFENMLGLIRGRVYYNLQNWYRLIRLFPGFDYNREFMEGMMGIKEPLEQEQAPPVTFWKKWFVELPALLRLLFRSSWNFYFIESLVEKFETNFHKHYDHWTKVRLDRLAPADLMELYDEMEEALLWNWKAPIINDFYVMIFYGTLKKLCGKWCQDETGALQNDLICGEGGIESAEPARMLLRMAKVAQEDPQLREKILTVPPRELPSIVAATARYRLFSDMMKEYLELYGFRCMNELKLEELSLRDRPHVVYQILRNYLALDDPAMLDVSAMHARELDIRENAQKTAFDAVAKSGGFYPKSAIFRQVLSGARRGVKNRENMRFARTRIYGLLREVLRATGAFLARERIIDDREDVFYLTLDEVRDYIKGTAVCADLRGLVAVRRAEYDEYQQDEEAAPAERFETFGMVNHRNLFQNSAAIELSIEDGQLQGIGCCPGIVEGVVKIVRNPNDDINLNGEILVAERTDPGWVPLYPAVSGILIERGSILSHSAVVAREMGIPTIVGISGLVKSLENGQKVRMDGAAGTVKVE